MAVLAARASMGPALLEMNNYRFHNLSKWASSLTKNALESIVKAYDLRCAERRLVSSSVWEVKS